MNNIPTAEATLRSILGSCNIEYHELKEACPEIIEECLETIISQNKLHVQAALQAASEDVKVNIDEYGNVTGYEEIMKESILNAYPLENIK